MRVLLTTDTVGGVWTFTQELAAGLLAREHHVRLVAFGRPALATQEEWCATLEAAYPHQFQAVFSSAPLEWMENNESAYEDGARALLEIVDEFGPDLLHSSQFCFGALSTKCPRLITAHSDVLSWAKSCRPQGFAPSPWLNTYVTLVEAGLRGAHALTAPTDWMLRAVRDNYQELPANQRVIANGRSLPVATVQHRRKLQAVSVGRLWDEGKNVRLLAEIHSRWPLLVAGDQQLGEAVAQDSLGRVQMLGVLGADELLALFRESSAYLCTSKYEPFGLAPLEAALCGCALLLHDLPSLHEIWGDAAMYFRNAAELSALLLRIANSPERLRFAQRRARERAKHFSAARMVEGYLTLYGELLSEAAEDGTGELTPDVA